jgi:Alpha/beta hydrolase domain
MVVNSEMESTPCYAVRQPDTDLFRLWETAGTSHVYYQAMASVAPRFERDFGIAIPVERGMNEVPTAPVNDAALHHVQDWLNGGAPPPAQPRIEFAGDPPEIVRDEHGIARGGIRLPQVEVPIATHSAIPAGPEFTQRLGGSTIPFSDEKLRALYSDAATYLARFEEATRAAEKAGVVLPRDVDALVEDARTNCPLE